MAQININVLGWTTNPLLHQHRKSYAYGQEYTLPVPTGFIYPFQLNRPHNPFGLSRFDLIRQETGEVFNILPQIQSNGGLSITYGDEFDNIKYLGLLPLTGSWEDGLYYARMSDNENDWTSEYFTFCSDLSQMIKLEWWNDTPITFSMGCLDYGYPYKNLLYIPTLLGKPRYPSDRQVASRELLEFKITHSTAKEYVFTFLLTEYLADCLRLVAQHDHQRVTHLGEIYDCEVFRMEDVAWLERGDFGRAVFSFVAGSVFTTNANPANAVSQPQPNTCLSTFAIAEDIFGVAEFINNVSNPLYFGQPGERVLIDTRVDLGQGLTGGINLYQVSETALVPSDGVAGSIVFEASGELFYVHTGTTETYALPRVVNVVEGTGPSDATLTGLVPSGSTVQVEFQIETGEWATGQTYTAAQINAGVTVDATNWRAVRLIILSPVCGPLQTTSPFLVDFNLAPPSGLEGLDYDAVLDSFTLT